MEEKTYIYTCMDCSCEWESEKEDETYCPKCNVSDINKEVSDDKSEI